MNLKNEYPRIQAALRQAFKELLALSPEKLSARLNKGETNMATTRKVDYEELIAEMLETMEECDGEDIAEIFNEICANKAEYLGDDQWKITVQL